MFGYKLDFDHWCAASGPDGRWKRIYPPKWSSPLHALAYRLFGYRSWIWWTPIVKRVGD